MSNVSMKTQTEQEGSLMPIRIEIPDDSTRHLNEQAKRELKKAVVSHGEEILREANYLEANLRSTSGQPEITSSNIKDATLIVRRNLGNRRKPIGLILIKLGASFFALATGFVKDYINQPWGPYAFALTLTAAGILLFIQFIRE